jgi:endonuclease YncB( thermonuclease family)
MTKQPSVSYTYNAHLVRVVDGDTIVADVDCGFYIHYRVILRLLHVNAPESQTSQGRIITKKLARYLARHKDFIVRTHRRDRYGRYLAEVTANGVNVNNLVRSWSNGPRFSRRERAQRAKRSAGSAGWAGGCYSFTMI